MQTVGVLQNQTENCGLEGKSRREHTDRQIIPNETHAERQRIIDRAQNYRQSTNRFAD